MSFLAVNMNELISLTSVSSKQVTDGMSITKNQKCKMRI